MSSIRAGGPGPRSGLVGSQVAYAAVGPLLVVEADPVGDDDASFRQRVELLAVEALVTEAGVKGFDVAVLPGRAGVDVEGADAAPSRRDVGHEVTRPHMAGVGGLRGDASGGVAAAWPPRLLLRDAEAEDAAQLADLPQADRRQPLGRQEPVDQDLGLGADGG